MHDLSGQPVPADLLTIRAPMPDWFRWAIAHPGQSQFLTVAGCRIHYLVWARELARPDVRGLLFVHGCGYRKSHPGWRRCRDGLSSLRDDRLLEAARRIAPRTVQIACGSRSRVGISPPAACCPEAVRAGEAQAVHCRSLDLRLALSAVPLLARS